MGGVGEWGAVPRWGADRGVVSWCCEGENGLGSRNWPDQDMVAPQAAVLWRPGLHQHSLLPRLPRRVLKLLWGDGAAVLGDQASLRGVCSPRCAPLNQKVCDSFIQFYNNLEPGEAACLSNAVVNPCAVVPCKRPLGCCALLPNVRQYSCFLHYLFMCSTPCFLKAAPPCMFACW